MTGQEFLELAQHGIHRAGMERVGCPDAANGNPCLGKTLAQCTDLVFGPGDHTVTRIVYRGQLDLRWQVLRDVIGAKSHRDHGTGRRLMHKAARSDTVLIAVCRSNTPARVAAMYSPVLYPMYAPARTPKVSTNFASAYSTVNNAGCERSMRSRSVAVPSNTSACKSMPVSSRNPAAQVSKCWAKTGSVS